MQMVQQEQWLCVGEGALTTDLPNLVGERAQNSGSLAKWRQGWLLEDKCLVEGVVVWQAVRALGGC